MRQIIALPQQENHIKGTDLQAEEADALLEIDAYGERGKFRLKVWYKSDERIYGLTIWKISRKSKRYLYSHFETSKNKVIVMGAEYLARETGFIPPDA